MKTFVPDLRRTTPFARLAALLALALSMLPALAVAAFAHASLVAAEPADGAMLQAAPTRLTLSFSEPVSPLAMTLIAPDGGRTALEDIVLRDTTLDIATPAGLGKGTHVLSWRVVSTDGHPVGGSVVFSIGAPSAAPIVVEAADWPVRGALWAGRVALYTGLFLGVGGIFAGAFLTRDGPGRRFAAACLGLGAAGAVLSLGAQGLDALGAPLGRIGDSAVWQAAIATSFVRTVIVAALAFALALAAVLTGGAKGRLLAAAALAATGLALALSGHAGAAEPQWLTRPMVFLHGAGIAFWAGALVPLGLSLRRGGAAAAAALRRFSVAIPYSVGALVIAGGTLAIVQVGHPAALLDTAYGNVLLVKLALLATLFVLAIVNRFRLTRPALAGDGLATRRLTRMIVVEIALVLAIFAVAAVWRFTPPPRTLAIAAAQPAMVHIHTAQAMADVTVTPGQTGAVTVSIMLMTGEFGALDAREVTLVLANPEAGIEPIRRPAQKPGDGTWRVDGLVIPAAGRWTIRIHVLVSDYEMLRLGTEIEIRP